MVAPAGNGVPPVAATLGCIPGAWVMLVVRVLMVIAETAPAPVNTTDRFRPVVLITGTVVSGMAGVRADQNQTGTATVYCSAQVPPGGTAIMNAVAVVATETADRKSTRLNSSHLGISYAVFC